MAKKMKVWIDQDLCTGDGICAEICPKIFEMDDDGLAYVKEELWPNRFGPDGKKPADGLPAVRHGQGKATKPDTVSFTNELADAVVEAAEECPGECIFIDIIEDK